MSHVKNTAPRLYAVYLGGRAKGCTLEQHDVVFAAGTTLEDTYPILFRKWFGLSTGLHIDAWIALDHVDGYEVTLVKDVGRSQARPRLFYVNLGAYRPGRFAEDHASQFYVAADKREARKKAKSELCLELEQVHTDDLVRLDDCVEVDASPYQIRLTQSGARRPLTIHNGYLKLPRPENASTRRTAPLTAAE